MRKRRPTLKGCRSLHTSRGKYMHCCLWARKKVFPKISRFCIRSVLRTGFEWSTSLLKNHSPWCFLMRNSECFFSLNILIPSSSDLNSSKQSLIIIWRFLTVRLGGNLFFSKEEDTALEITRGKFSEVKVERDTRSWGPTYIMLRGKYPKLRASLTWNDILTGQEKFLQNEILWGRRKRRGGEEREKTFALNVKFLNVFLIRKLAVVFFPLCQQRASHDARIEFRSFDMRRSYQNVEEKFYRSPKNCNCISNFVRQKTSFQGGGMKRESACHSVTYSVIRIIILWIALSLVHALRSELTDKIFMLNSCSISNHEKAGIQRTLGTTHERRCRYRAEENSEKMERMGVGYKFQLFTWPKRWT